MSSQNNHIEYKLPKGWEKTELENLIQYVIGGDWGKDISHPDTGFQLAYCIRGSEMKNWDEERGRTAALRKLKRSSIENRKLIEGDIIVEISGGGPEQPVGRTVLIDKSVLSFEPRVPKVCTNFFRLIRPVKEINSAFLNFYLKYFYKTSEIGRYQSGSNNLRNLKFNDYVKVKVPFPNLSIQQEIVSKIEELFSELDKGIEQLKTAQQQLKIYRQSVLKAAFEGKLTSRKVPQAGVEPLSVAAEAEIPYGNNGNLPKGWKWVKFGELMESVKNGYSKKPDDKGNYKILRISSVRPTKVNINDVRYLKNEIDEDNSVKENDLLFTRYNGSIDFVGVCGRVPSLKEKLYYPDKLIRCRPIIKNKLHSAYLEYACNYGESRKFVLSRIKTTAGQTGIAGNEIKLIPVPLAPLNKQCAIVQEIENRLSVADKMEETIVDSLQQAEALRQSILKKAFEGKLI